MRVQIGHFNLFESEEEKAARLRVAEELIRDQHPLYRHYCVPEVQRAVDRHSDVTISRGEARSLVQKVRDECGMGPIADDNV